LDAHPQSNQTLKRDHRRRRLSRFSHPNIVFVGGIDLFRSDDGGVNWGLASHSLGGQERAAVAPAPIITRWSFTRRCNGASRRAGKSPDRKNHPCIVFSVLRT
jgi:hypothetical protein